MIIGLSSPLPQYTFQLRECACGEGEVNLRKYMELATQFDKEMPMIIEHLNTDEEYLASLAYAKKIGEGLIS